MRAGTAHAHFFLGRYDEAKSWAALALQHNPKHNPALRIGAASDAMAGRLEQAQKTIIRLQQVYPTLGISNLKDVLGPYRRAEDPHDTRKGCGEPGYPNECRGQGDFRYPWEVSAEH
jgi:adenylate cyclase